MKRDELTKFFSPKSIAIIGASEKEEKVGGILLERAMKTSAEVIAVNPTHDEILGKKCYKSVLDYKKEIDLAVIAIPAQFVPASLEECGKKGIKNVILVSASFSETGNTAGVKEIQDIANKHKIRFLGSNCFGVCNPSESLDLTFAAITPKKGKVAFISQSGALWSYISDVLSEVGFSKFVSLGNMENLDFNDFIEYFTEDPETDAIILYIEKLKDGKKFMEICEKAVKKKKKIYAVKGGSSSIGAKAEISHTASLASDYAVYSGAIKQSRIVLCENILDAFEKASNKKIDFKKKSIKLGKKAFILTNAGGAGVILSDYLSKKGAEIIEKPLDILGTALAEDYKKNFEEIRNKNFNDLFVVVTPQSMSDIEKIAESVTYFKKELTKEKRNVIAVFLGRTTMEKANKIFEKNKIDFVNIIEEI